MYNIEQMKNRLESPVVTDQDLVNFVQNPGQVPSYLALAELQRRQEIRQSAPINQGPQPPVAQQLIQEVKNADTSMFTPHGIAGLQTAGANVTPPVPMQDPMMMADSGVANLPVDPGMFQEQNFAQGGIVAFADGSKKPIEAKSVSELTADELNALDPTQLKRLQQIQGDRERLKRLGKGALGAVTIPAQVPLWGLEAGANAVGVPRLGKALGIYDPDVSSVSIPRIGLSDIFSPIDTSKEALLKQTRQPTATELAASNEKKLQEDVQKAAPPEQFTSTEKTPQDYYKEFLDQSGTSGTNPFNVPKMTYDKNRFLGDLEDETGLAEKGMERYSTMMGENEFAKSIEAANKKKQSKRDELERTNTGYGMLKAAEKLLKVRQGQEGVGMGEALGAFTDEYQKGLDKIEALDDKIENNNLQLGKDKRDERRAATNYGLDNEKTIKANNRATKTADKTYQMEVEKTNIQTALKGMEEAGALARTNTSARASITAAMINSAKEGDFDKTLRYASQDPAYLKVVNGKQIVDIAKVMKLVKPGSNSAGLDEDTIARAYVAGGGKDGTGQDYNTFKSQFTGGGIDYSKYNVQKLPK